MLPRLTFRCAILTLTAIFLIQVILLNVYFNLAPFDLTASVIKAHNASLSRLVTTVSRPGLSSHLNYSCDIQDGQAVLALKRMKTFQCQQNCIEVYCQVIQNKLWPPSLTSQCNHFGIYPIFDPTPI